MRGETARMMTRRRASASLLALAIVAATLLLTRSSVADQGFWVAGDFHVHTTYSHDSWDPLHDDEESEVYTLGHSVGNQFAVAASRGLHFLAITDHNDIRSQSDAGFGSMGVLGVRGYENSLRWQGRSQGHAQVLGATSIYTNGDGSAATVNAMAGALRADGGLFQVNHPAGGSVNFPDDADWRYAYDVVPDSVEVWNIQSVWQPPAFSSNSIDDAIRYWEGWLTRGEKVAATGGSDNHWVSTTAAQGVGQPTTWVYVTELTERAILDGVLAGRTVISWQPPAYVGPRLFLEADADGDGVFEAMVGDEITPTASTRYRARVENAPPGSLLVMHTPFGARVEAVVSGTVTTLLETPEAPAWMWVDLLAVDHTDVPQVSEPCDDLIGGSSTYCRNRLARLAMTSAIYAAV